MKKCRNCGADLPEGASFCPHCAQSQIERQEVKPPRLWRKKALIAALCALVLVTAALAVFLPHRPKTYEGGASVTYTDQDGTYELLVGTSLNNIEDKQPEEKRTLSLSVDETSYLPAMLGVYRTERRWPRKRFLPRWSAVSWKHSPTKTVHWISRSRAITRCLAPLFWKRMWFLPEQAEQMSLSGR